MAATTTACGFSPVLHVLSSPTTERDRPIYSNPYSYSYKPFSASKINPTITLSRSRTKTAAPKRSYKTTVIFGLENGNSETHPESDSSFSNSDATIDIKLPRRSMLVQFTCDLCGERTQRLVNRLAYERGLIYVQCAGCLQHHKLVDNLGLVVEYDLREEIYVDRNEDEF